MTFRIAHLTDSHLYSIEQQVDRDRLDAMFETLCEEAFAHDVELVLHTGDFVNGHCGVEAHERFHDRFRSVCENHSLPAPLMVRGNHDARITDGQYAAVYGDGTWLHHHRGWAILGVDRYTGCYEHTQHAFAMAPETIDRVRELLGKVIPGTPMIVMLHDDPVGVSRFHRGMELMHLLEPHNVRLLLFGHVQASYLGRFRGIPFVTCTGDDRPHDNSALNYNIITCTDHGEATCDFHPFRLNTPTIQTDSLRPTGSVKLGDDWPSLRGPSGTRCAPATSFARQRPQLVWSRTLGGGFGATALTLAGGTLVATTMGHGRFDRCHAHALDAATGESRWSLPLDGCAEGGMGLDVEAGMGYVGTSAGSLYCVEFGRGEVRWRWNNRDNMPIACQPVVHDGLVHCGANWEMYAVDAELGRTVWRKVATRDGFCYMGPGNASPLVVGDRVFHQRPFNATARGQSEMQSLIAATGDDLQVVTGAVKMHPRFRQASPVESDSLVIGAANGLFAVDPANPGEALWHVPDRECSATPAAANGRALISNHHEIVAHDLNAAGRVLWRVAHEASRLHFGGEQLSKTGAAEPRGSISAPLVVGDTVIVCDTGGRVRGLDVTTGEEHWRFTLPEPILTAPVVSGNAMFVAGYFGTIHALNWPT